MNRPGRQVISRFEAAFHDYDLTELSSSPNSLPYLAEKDGSKFFVKIVDKSLAQEEGLSDVETKLASLECPSLIKLVAFGDLDEKYQYLQFEFVEGNDLSEVTLPLAPDNVKNLALKMVDALEVLWANNLVHRDIKPKNIMQSEDGSSYQLVDLGIGYFVEKAHRDNTKYGSGRGSRFYSAPEQIWANSNLPYSITFAADQFSLGVVLYELVVGEHPFKKPPTGSGISNYAEAVTGAVTPKHLSEFGVVDPLASTIMRMIERYPSKRFTTLSAIRDALNGTSSDSATNDTSVFLHMPSRGMDEFYTYLESEEEFPRGIVLSAGAKEDWAEKVTDTGRVILIDPQTYKLQLNKSTTTIATKLGLPQTENFTILDLNRLQSQIVDGVINLPLNLSASTIILPYYTVTEPGGDHFKLMKEMWNDAPNIKSRHLELAHKKLFAAMQVSTHVVNNEESRAKLLSQLVGKYDLDGIYLVFETSASNIATISDLDYLKGLKEIIQTCEDVFGEVIVSRTDLSAITFMRKGIYVTGWPKSSRHFDPNRSGRNGPYKMKYYAENLFTFIEEQSNIRIIVGSGFETDLSCACTTCTANNPLSTAYRPDEHQEFLHFYGRMKELEAATTGKTYAQKTAHYLSYVQSAHATGLRIKAGTSGVISNQIIPNFEGLISLIS